MTGRRAILLGAAVLLAWSLGGHDLWAPDEPYFAEGAREMLADAQWVVPHVNGVVTTDKPPLFFWLIALFSLPFGAVTEWTARLPSVFAGLGTVALTMRLAARWYGQRTAALAGALLATTFLFWQKARWSQTDMVLCCCIWVALSAFEACRSGTSDGRSAGLLFWLAAALAVLTKGPVGFLLPLGIALVTLAWDRDLSRWRRFAPLAGPALFAAVVGGWILWTVVGGPDDYSVWAALREHFVDRGLQGMHHKQPPWYFLGALPPNLLPWTGLVPGGLVLAWRRRLPGDRMALTVALFVLVFFSISTEKRELYQLPAFPAYALMTAGLVAWVCGWQEPRQEDGTQVDRRWVTIGHGVVGALLALVGVAVGVAGVERDEIPLAAAVVVGALCLVGGAVTLVYLMRRRPLAAVATTAVAISLVFVFGETFVSPALDRTKSVRPFAEQMKEITAESRARGISVVAYRIGNIPEPLAFYSDGVYTLETEDADLLREHLGRSEEAFAVVDRDRLEGLDDLAARVHVVASASLARRDLLLLGNRPRPQSVPLDLPDGAD